MSLTDEFLKKHVPFTKVRQKRAFNCYIETTTYHQFKEVCKKMDVMMSRITTLLIQDFIEKHKDKLKK